MYAWKHTHQHKYYLFYRSIATLATSHFIQTIGNKHSVIFQIVKENEKVTFESYFIRKDHKSIRVPMPLGASSYLIPTYRKEGTYFYFFQIKILLNLYFWVVSFYLYSRIFCFTFFSLFLIIGNDLDFRGIGIGRCTSIYLLFWPFGKKLWTYHFNKIRRTILFAIQKRIEDPTSNSRFERKKNFLDTTRPRVDGVPRY